MRGMIDDIVALMSDVRQIFPIVDVGDMNQKTKETQ
jgi:hypothetical protein